LKYPKGHYYSAEANNTTEHNGRVSSRRLRAVYS